MNLKQCHWKKKVFTFLCKWMHLARKLIDWKITFFHFLHCLKLDHEGHEGLEFFTLTPKGPFINYVGIFLGFLNPLPPHPPCKHVFGIENKHKLTFSDPAPLPPASAYVIYEWTLKNVIFRLECVINIFNCFCDRSYSALWEISTFFKVNFMTWPKARVKVEFFSSK